MLKGTTTSGFVFEVDEGVNDDMELLENLIRLDKQDITVLPDVMDSLLGDKKPDLSEHCRGEHVRVSATAVMAEIKEIFENAGKLKN